MGRYEGTLADGRRGMIVTTRESYSAPGANVTAEQWEAIFGKKQRKDSYRLKARYGEQKIEEEWWSEQGQRFYRKTVDGRVVEFKNETTEENISVDCAAERTHET